MLADRLDVVIGVDTHKHTLAAAAVSATGEVLEHLTVPANAKGYGAHRVWATPWSHAGGH